MVDIVTLGGSEEGVLRKKASLLADIDGSVAALAKEMVASLGIHNGIGLAGPQIGYGKRIFVCHVQGDKPRVFINPEIIRTSPETLPFEEGCLSIPGVYADVMRPAEITIQALDEKGKPFTLDADGILARVIQHENDHLNGTLFIDHLNERKRGRLIKIYNKKFRA